MRSNRLVWAAFRLLVVAALGLAAIAWAGATRASAAPGDIGFQGPNTSGAGTSPSGEKPESKLWFNDGFWWGSLWDTTSARFEIFKLDTATQTWTSTDVPIDTRTDTHADALWDGTKLYVSSHVFDTSPQVGAADASRLYRFSYDAGTDTYSLDTGFPATINNWDTETLVIAKDSTGKLWATWIRSNRVYMNRTTGSDSSWGTPFVLPGATGLAGDDISSVVAFSGQIGVMWSNQNDDTMHFAVHPDGAGDTTSWTLETAYGGPGTNLADDHINMKTSGGLVYAATKTSNTGASDPLNVLLVRSAGGSWSSHTFGTVSDNHSRPIVLIDEAGGVVHVIATSKPSQAAIFQKTSPLGSISFPAGNGTTLINPADTTAPNNATSTKQNLTDASDLVVVATGGSSYWHQHQAVGGDPPTNGTPPSIAGNPTVGQSLTADPGLWNGSQPITFGYQWQSCSPTCANIADATGQTYQLTSAELDGMIQVVVTASNGFPPDGVATSAQVGPVTASATFAPTDDAQVNSSSPSTNYGGSTTLRLRSGSPSYNAYLKFVVSGLTGTVGTATLRLFVPSDGGPDGGIVYAVSNDFLGTGSPWTESGLNYNNAPTIGGTALDSAGSVSPGTWVDLDVTSAVTGDGTFSFGLKNADTNSVYYSSKEGATDPELVVTVQSSSDTTPPTVTNRSPAPDSVDVPVSTNVTATFSEGVQGVDGTTLKLKQGTTEIPATVSYSPTTDVATLTPSSPLAPSTVYTMELTGGASAIRDLADNPLASESWNLTTASADTTPPTVTNRSPAPDSVDVPVSTNVTATFSEDVQGVDGTTFKLKQGTTEIPASVSYSSTADMATLTPSSPLAPSTVYTVEVIGGASAIRDLADNPLASESWSFTTGSAPAGIALNGSAISGSIATGTTVTLPSWTPAANDLMLVSVAQREESLAISVSGNGLTWTEVANVDNVQGQGGISLWRAQGPAPTSGSITVTITGNTAPVTVIAQRFSGVSTTTPVEAIATNPGPAADNDDLLHSVTTATSDAWAVAASWYRTATFALPSGETAILLNAVGGSSGGVTRSSMWYQGPIVSPASVELGVTDDLSAANDWAVILVSLRPA